MKHFDEYLDYHLIILQPPYSNHIFSINLNLFLQEYSLIMSERDTFHKEMEKLQDEVFVYLKYQKSKKVYILKYSYFPKI